MLTERLQARCSSAKPRTVAYADNYALAFCKRSHDGSGKATIYPRNGSRVLGVIFDLDKDELPKLDDEEGIDNGYDRIDNFHVYTLFSHQLLVVSTYIADTAFIDRKLKPYDWYLKLAVAGARQHGLPLWWLQKLETCKSITDAQLNRNSRIEALALLEE